MSVFTPAGQFRTRVAILRRQGGRTNGLGERIPAEDVVATVWAKVWAVASAETPANAAVPLIVTYQVRLRYTELVTHVDALIYRGRRLEIADITDIRDMRRELAITAYERKP